jgi:hypothetical protein
MKLNSDLHEIAIHNYRLKKNKKSIVNKIKNKKKGSKDKFQVYKKASSSPTGF